MVSRIDTPTNWCAGMVIVPKHNGRVRICVDLTKLNESVKRSRHILPAVDGTLAKLQRAKFLLNWIPILAFGRYLLQRRAQC